MTNKKKRFLWIIIIILLVFIVSGFLLWLDYYRSVTLPYKGFDNPITIEVNQGDTVSDVGKLLYEKKIISDFTYFKIFYRLNFKNQSFKLGEYEFSRPMTMTEVIDTFVQGKVVLHKVTINEGLIIKEIAEVVEKNRGIPYDSFINEAKRKELIQDLDPDAPDLEGYLFPDTYNLQKKTTAGEMVELMVKRFRDNFTNAMRARAEELGMTVRQTLTLASLIEKETALREERFLISSVFHNRLKTGMTLGCDPTIIYALKRDNLYSGKLGWAELKYDSPYNSRLHKGLPPGPICNPGYASIEAALYPENTSYLYFVAKDSGSHIFTENLNDHNAAVYKYIKKRK